MNSLREAIIQLVANTPTEKVEQLAGVVARLQGHRQADGLGAWAQTAASRARLQDVIAAWQTVPVSPLELSGILSGAAAAYHFARAEQQVELVWTGPSSSLVATRKTEQALIEVVDAAAHRLFITSFVAYNIATIVKALGRALDRGVEISMLLEASDKDGGGVSVDGIAKMKFLLPKVRVFSWTEKAEGFYGGKVHAKVAVADATFCFVSSANLTGHAMEKNMEAGVLIRGGKAPRDLHEHLTALETTKVIARV